MHAKPSPLAAGLHRRSSGIATTGIIGTIGSGKPIIMLRSDIDALPVEEPEGFEDRSLHPGRMHACGHDTHMAMLLGEHTGVKAAAASQAGLDPEPWSLLGL